MAAGRIGGPSFHGAFIGGRYAPAPPFKVVHDDPHGADTESKLSNFGFESDRWHITDAKGHHIIGGFKGQPAAQCAVMGLNLIWRAAQLPGAPRIPDEPELPAA